jgi:type I restriction enzyme M protein
MMSVRRKQASHTTSKSYQTGKEEAAIEVFDRIQGLYKTAYARYIDTKATEPDEIDKKVFPPERLKTVVKALQGMSITRGSALHADVIGTFFEEILRVGFKQDKGMYFTHDNLVSFLLA